MTYTIVVKTKGTLSYNHTVCQASRQVSAACEASDLCNGSGTHLELQVKRHHRLALVTLPLPLTPDTPPEARCEYTFTHNIDFYHFLTKDSYLLKRQSPNIHREHITVVLRREKYFFNNILTHPFYFISI